jgi:uncharacterized protein (DUF736 family)
MEYDNTNSGMLGKNDYKTEEKHPDYRGKINVEGVEYKISGWIRTKKADGTKFLSLKLSHTQGDPQGIATPAQQIAGLDNDIPF